MSERVPNKAEKKGGLYCQLIYRMMLFLSILTLDGETQERREPVESYIFKTSYRRRC